MSKYIRLREEIQNSKAAYYLGGLLKLRDYHIVFVLNYREFKAVFEKFESPENLIRMWSVDKRQELDLILLDITRRLLNFLASMKFRIETTRRLMRELYSDDPFLEEYNQHVTDTYANNGLVKFLEELRNYTLHFDPPYVTSNMSIENIEDGKGGEIKHKILISPTLLPSWNGWSKLSLEFMSNYPDGIDIQQVIDDYYNIAESTNEWLQAHINEKHEANFDWYNKKVIELNSS